MKEKIVALVPMRHHSERVPGKNFRELAGKPLYTHILETLQVCPEIDHILIDTDSPVIAAGVREEFPLAQVVERPEHLLGDDVAMNDILLSDVTQTGADFFLQTHSTNPLLRPETVSKAIAAFWENYPSYDSLFSVTRLYTRLWDANGKPVNHDPNVLLRTQDLPPMYLENSCMYIFSKKALQERHNRLGYHPFMFEISAEEAWDIDTELDFAIADYLKTNNHRDHGDHRE